MEGSPFKSKQARLADAANLLARAVALHQRGATAEAEPLYRQVLAADRKNFDALHLLGVIAAQRGNPSEGYDLLRQSLQVNPRSAEAHINLGRVLVMLDRQTEALASFDQAIAIDPSSLLALTNRGAVLAKLNRPDEAVSSYDQALALKSDHLEALYNRGNALNILGRHAEALASFDKVLGPQPRHARALIGRANALRGLDRPDEALDSLDKALAADADNVLALTNRGNTLSDLRRYDEALPSYERVLALAPGHPTALAGFAFAAISVCDFGRSETLKFQLEAAICERSATVPPFTFLSISGDAALQRQCAEAWIRDAFPVPPAPLWRGEVRRHDRIRLAYLSANFRAHAMSYLIAETIELHDRARFEVIGVSTGPDDGSDARARIVKAVDQFHAVQARSDDEVARLLFELEADIVVDLNGHTLGGRLGILARRPAPIQMSYIGFPGTSGSDFIDYILADDTVLPADQHGFFTENVISLPDTYWLHDSHTKVAARFPTRREAALPDRGFVFCCFNNNYKITPPVFDIWMRLLRAVPGSVLWLLQDNAAAETNLRKRGARARRRSGAARIRPARPARRASRAPSARRPVPRHAAGQRPHHGERRLVDGRAGGDLPGLVLRRARGGKPGEGRGTAGSRDRQPCRVRGACACPRQRTGAPRSAAHAAAQRAFELPLVRRDAREEEPGGRVCAGLQHLAARGSAGEFPSDRAVDQAAGVTIECPEAARRLEDYRQVGRGRTRSSSFRRRPPAVSRATLAASQVGNRSMRRRFVTLDVFTDRRFAGNPLAVVLEPAGLDTAAMQAVAREFNLSETVFVQPPDEAGHRAGVRIFTPTRELPFAGHPTVGTAVLLAPARRIAGRRDHPGGGDRARCAAASKAAGTIADTPASTCRGCPNRCRRRPTRPRIAAALSLAPTDIGYAGFSPAVWSAGNPFLFVPVARLAAMARARPDMARWDAAPPGPSGSSCSAARRSSAATPSMPACSRRVRRSRGSGDRLGRRRLRRAARAAGRARPTERIRSASSKATRWAARA